MYLNECSKLQVKFLFGHEGIMGRLTQGKVILTEEEVRLMSQDQYQYGNVNGVKCYYYELVKQYYYDFNPPSKSHWTYQYFIQGINPLNLTKILRPENFYVGKINPIENPYSTDRLFEQIPLYHLYEFLFLNMNHYLGIVNLYQVLFHLVRGREGRFHLPALTIELTT